MPYTDLRDGSKVKVGGKSGTIREVADKFKVKFDDGSIGFYDGNEITPDVVVSELKCRNKLDRLKAESKIRQDEIFMEPTATGSDPLAQPKRSTGHGVGEPQTVLGKEVSQDMFNKQE